MLRPQLIYTPQSGKEGASCQRPFYITSNLLVLLRSHLKQGNKASSHTFLYCNRHDRLFTLYNKKKRHTSKMPHPYLITHYDFSIKKKTYVQLPKTSESHLKRDSTQLASVPSIYIHLHLPFLVTHLKHKNKAISHIFLKYTWVVIFFFLSLYPIRKGQPTSILRPHLIYYDFVSLILQGLGASFYYYGPCVYAPKISECTENTRLPARLKMYMMSILPFLIAHLNPPN